jgi:hypothetical protein
MEMRHHGPPVHVTSASEFAEDTGGRCLRRRVNVAILGNKAFASAQMPTSAMFHSQRQTLGATNVAIDREFVNEGNLKMKSQASGALGARNLAISKPPVACDNI